ncbi:hypothetical protein TNCV_3777831, partial [Trichonephila clavipes]
VLDESRSFFRVHTGYFSNIPKCIKAEFIASWACSQSSVVSELPASLRLRGLSPEFGLLKENSRKRTKMPTEQEAKPAVVTPSLQQWRSPSTFEERLGKTLLKWLKEYDQ